MTDVNETDTRESPGPITGGCQCGEVRYQIAGLINHAHFCHCRMCQRAVGNVFAALVMTPKEKLIWIGKPKLFSSSNLTYRGFCGTCGTPLSFTYHDSDLMAVTIGSLDEPKQAEIEAHFGTESMMPWLKLSDDCERKTSGEGMTKEWQDRFDSMVSYQANQSEAAS